MRPTSPVNLTGIAAAVFVTAGVLAPLASAATPVRLTGSIAGEVRNGTGVAQMGATIILLNRYDRVLRQTLSNEKGAFVFDSLLPDLYSVRVSLSSFVPAIKKGINVQPGLQSMLTINLAGVLSSIELVYTAPAGGALMSDDWKWVLRSSQATRPVLRFHEVIYRERVDKATKASVFSETRGLVRVSGGDSTSAGIGMQPDLGTAFALATSLFGSNELQVSGNLGYSSQAGMPTAGFRTTYVRTSDTSAPEVTVTMRQVALPMRGGFGPAVQNGGPALRTAAATFIDHARLLDNLSMDYGLTVESISIMNRLNTVTPFARLNYDLGTSGMLQMGYSSGTPPSELAGRTLERGVAREHELSQDLSALSALPLVSMRDGRARVQRTDSVEVGYRKTAGSRSYSFGAYREKLRDAILTMGDMHEVPMDNADLLPSFSSNSAIFNAGAFERWGYMASISQALTETLDVALAYGRGGALTTGGNHMPARTANELRSALTMSHRNWATLRMSGTAPLAGTRFIASYGWMDSGSISPARLSLTQSAGPEPGLNLSVRQPIPSAGLFPGRLEAVAELRNMMAQGYLPVVSASGRTAVLTNAPRSMRGGLNFIF